MRATTIMIMFFGLATLTIGLLKIHSTEKQRQLWNKYETALNVKNDLNSEWNKLKLEESMLITSVLLDNFVSEKLNLVLPQQKNIVYVMEQPSRAIVSSTRHAKDSYVQ